MKIKDISYGFAQHGDNFVQIRRLCSTFAEWWDNATGGYVDIKPDTDLQELAEYACYNGSDTPFGWRSDVVAIQKEQQKEQPPEWFLAHCVVPGEEEAKAISRFFGMLGVNAKFLEYFGACSICGAAESVSIRKTSYFVCHKHKIKWGMSYGLFGGWMEENGEIWQDNWEQIENYRDVDIELVHLAWYD